MDLHSGLEFKKMVEYPCKHLEIQKFKITTAVTSAVQSLKRCQSSKHSLHHFAPQNLVATMANLNAVIAAYESLQRYHFEPQVSVLVTGDGRITIPAIDFLSFGGITENMLLNDFVKFIKRDKLTTAFRLLLDLD